MASEDLRGWLAKVESMGELKRVEGADWNLEIGCFADPKVSGEMRSVFLFDNIKDSPSGFRFCNPRLVTEGQTTLTLNLPKSFADGDNRYAPAEMAGMGSCFG